MSRKPNAGWKALAVAGLASLAVPAMAVSARLPGEQHEGSVGYITGGIGKTEAQLFEREMPKHPLAIELLEHTGKVEEFTADAKVRITDGRGHTVLDAQAGGPFMLVDLPPGRYSVAASIKNTTLKKSAVYVKRGELARATFEFPAHAD